MSFEETTASPARELIVPVVLGLGTISHPLRQPVSGLGGLFPASAALAWTPAKRSRMSAANEQRTAVSVANSPRLGMRVISDVSASGVLDLGSMYAVVDRMCSLAYIGSLFQAHGAM